MAEYRRDHEDVTSFTLDPEGERELLRVQKECTFIWTNKEGSPVGVIMSYLETDDGHIWLTGSEQRKRFAAIRRDPRTCIVVTSAGTDLGTGKTVTYMGRTITHAKEDRKIKDWFYPTFARKLRGAGGELAVSQFVRLLDSPRRVVIEFIPENKIAFDGEKHRAADPPLELEAELARESSARG